MCIKNILQRYKRQSNNAGQYHYHANINCTDAGAATGANNPDTCKLIGENQCQELVKCIAIHYQVTIVMVFLCMDSARIHRVLCLLLATSSILEPQQQQLSQYQGPTLWPAPTQITPSLPTPTVTWMRLMVCFASQIIEKQAQLQVLFIQPQASTLTS